MTRHSIASTKLLQVVALALALHIGTHGYANNVQAYFTTSVNEGTVPLTVTFDAAEATGSGNLSFTWNFRDGTRAEGERVEHTFNHAGKYEVVLTVRSGDEMHSVHKKIKVLPVEDNLGEQPELVSNQQYEERVKYLEWTIRKIILYNGLEQLYNYVDSNNIVDIGSIHQFAPDRSWVSMKQRTYGANRYPSMSGRSVNTLIDLETGKKTVLPMWIDGLRTISPHFFPDAKTMLISQGGSLYITDVDNPNPELFFKGSDDFSYALSNISVKDDGSEVALYLLYGGAEENTPLGQGILPSYVLRLPVTLRDGDISDASVLREYKAYLPEIEGLVWQGDDVIILTKEQKLQ